MPGTTRQTSLRLQLISPEAPSLAAVPGRMGRRSIGQRRLTMPGGLQRSPVPLQQLPPVGSLAVTQQLSPGGSPLPGSTGRRNQLSKWGFAPGEDDTLDLNLESKGER